MKKLVTLFGIVLACFFIAACENVEIPEDPEAPETTNTNQADNVENTPTPTPTVTQASTPTPVATETPTPMPTATPEPTATITPKAAANIAEKAEQLGLPRKGTVATNTGNLNVRESQSISSPRLSRLSNKENITVLSVSYNEDRYWYEINFRLEDKLMTGYVAAEYVILDETHQGPDTTVYPTPTPTPVPDIGSQNLKYTSHNDNGHYYTLSGIGDCKDTHVVVPAYHDGLKVTSIDEYAFKDCKDLERITISSSITKIDTGAFDGCDKLVAMYYMGTMDEWCGVTVKCNVHSGNYLLFIGDVFIEDKLDISSGVSTISPGSFTGCYLLKNLTLPANISLMPGAFSECTGLKEVTIKSGAYIGDNAFKGCTNLKTVKILGSCRWIASGAFTKCSSELELYIPKTVTVIKEGFVDEFTMIYYAGSEEEWDALTGNFTNPVDKSKVVFNAVYEY
ncbi:MAG: leucine-rich repeat protein [Lachnospiraceae bacterium]|nr:leucine-rich repeat protein [Lachnospiraceae bacterium]